MIIETYKRMLLKNPNIFQETNEELPEVYETIE